MSEPVGTMHHVGIVVRDLDQAEAFVTSALGFPVVNRLASRELGMRAVFFGCGPAMIELIQFADPMLVRERLADRVAAIDHIALRVDDVEDTATALAAHGVDTADAIPTTLPGGRTHFTQANTSAGIIWQLLELATVSQAPSAAATKDSHGEAS
jgi:catechol 2,3-dioxygenase-like lactoylglutathione lyase family enzyme